MVYNAFKIYQHGLLLVTSEGVSMASANLRRPLAKAERQNTVFFCAFSY